MIVIKRILCPVDLSEFSPHVVDRAVALARAYGAPICVLHVLPVAAGVTVVPFAPEGPSSFGYHPVDRDQVLKDLPRLLALDKRGDVTIDVHVIKAPAVHQEILAAPSAWSSIPEPAVAQPPSVSSSSVSGATGAWSIVAPP